MTKPLIHFRCACLSMLCAFGSSRILANQPPTSNPGGPYTLTVGGSVVLNGALSNDPNVGGLVTSYSWGIDPNGTTTYLTGATPTLAWSSFPFAAGTYSIPLITTDTFGLTSAAGTATLNVVNDQDFAVLDFFGARHDSAQSGYIRIVQGNDGKLYGGTISGGAHNAGTLIRINSDGTGFTVLRSLTSATDGFGPGPTLIQGSDGRLYGVTASGGINNAGTLFAMGTDGTGFTVLRALKSSTDGSGPLAGLIQGSDGRLYGVTGSGGTNNGGTLFAMRTDGTGFAVLRSLTSAIDGSHPYGSLIQGSDGRLYGTTLIGGANGAGTLFATAMDGTGFTILRSLTSATDGSSNQAGLLQGRDGRLYGVNASGGAHNAGTLFAMGTDGTGFTVLRSLTSATDGSSPLAALIQGSDGRLYGSADQGGTNNAGTLFAMGTDGTGFTVLRLLTGATDGANPGQGLSQGNDGRLYGEAYTNGGAHSAGTLFAINTDGTGYTILHRFTGEPEGTIPVAGLIQGSYGRLYGSTTNGGSDGVGTLFAAGTDGAGFTVLRSLSSTTDGGGPVAILLQGSDSRLYGSTTFGGANSGGTLFAMGTDGTGFTVLRSLTGATDGSDPFGGLIQASDGRLYGTTSNSGVNSVGTLFAIETDGTGFTVLRSFTSSTDGANPEAGLIQGGDGRLYGATLYGGANSGGTLFAIGTDGTGFTVLRSLTSATDGANCGSSLILGSDGRLYGATESGGVNGGGTLFAIGTDGTGFTVLRSFSSATDGSLPFGSLIQGIDGRLYGTNLDGGAYGAGTLFATNADGTGFTVLRSLTSATDGANPQSGLAEGSDGKLYGTNPQGGPNGYGTIFVLFNFLPGVADHFMVSVPSNATAGIPVSVIVTALDSNGNTVTGYSGTVHFSSTDGASGLPADSMLTNGTGTFQVTFSSAGSMTVTATDVASLSIAGTSVPATVSLAPTPTPTPTVGVHAQAYNNGYFYTVSNSITYLGSPTAISWQATLPAGWTLISNAGNVGDTQPLIGTTGPVEWDWSASIASSPSPILFSYTVRAPYGATGQVTIAAQANVTDGGTVNYDAVPNPLTINLSIYHSADEARVGGIDLSDLTRVIELYNTHSGSLRTGCYMTLTTSEDGFDPDPSRPTAAVFPLEYYHSADEAYTGSLTLSDLTRVIELYNYHVGSTRTGQYSVAVGTEDGFQPGP